MGTLPNWNADRELAKAGCLSIRGMSPAGQLHRFVPGALCVTAHADGLQGLRVAESPSPRSDFDNRRIHKPSLIAFLQRDPLNRAGGDRRQKQPATSTTPC